jgi:serine/threonine-protein phosphatase 5
MEIIFEELPPAGRVKELIFFWRTQEGSLSDAEIAAAQRAKRHSRPQRVRSPRREQQTPTRLEWPEDASKVSAELVSELLRQMKLFGDDAALLKEVLPEPSLLRLLQQAQQLLRGYPNVVTLRVVPDGATTVHIVGDTHGQFYDMLQILESTGQPDARRWYVFNGDFVDRGSWGTEISIALFALKLLHPQYVHLTRGNHETTYACEAYGFMSEALSKYTRAAYDAFISTFTALPLACVLVPELSPAVRHEEAKQEPRAAAAAPAPPPPAPQQQPRPPACDEELKGRFAGGLGVLVLHGGLFRDKSGRLGTLDQLQQMDRSDMDPRNDPVEEVLWSDPNDAAGAHVNRMRGCGITFGADVTQHFLEHHGLSLLVRSHEGPDARLKRPQMKDDMMKGHAVDHVYADGRPLLVTVFSAPNYPQGPANLGNDGSVMDVRFCASGVSPPPGTPAAAAAAAAAPTAAAQEPQPHHHHSRHNHHHGHHHGHHHALHRHHRSADENTSDGQAVVPSPSSSPSPPPPQEQQQQQQQQQQQLLAPPSEGHHLRGRSEALHVRSPSRILETEWRVFQSHEVAPAQCVDMLCRFRQFSGAPRPETRLYMQEDPGDVTDKEEGD